MTFIEIEDAATVEAEPGEQTHQTIKCSWCGEIIRLDGNELAPAMCQACYERMLEEFVRIQQINQTATHHSDR